MFTLHFVLEQTFIRWTTPTHTHTHTHTRTHSWADCLKRQSTHPLRMRTRPSRRRVPSESAACPRSTDSISFSYIPVASYCICLLKLSVHRIQRGCIEQLFLVHRKWTAHQLTHNITTKFRSAKKRFTYGIGMFLPRPVPLHHSANLTQ